MYTAEGTLASWLRKSGERVEAGQTVAEIETEKAMHELPAPASGVLHQIAAAGARLMQESLLGYILAEGEAPPDAARPEIANREASPEAKIPDRPAADAGVIKASPIAKRLAAQHGLELASLQGSGPGGRIVEADVLAAVEKQKSAAPAIAAKPPPATKPGLPAVRQRVALTGIRRAVGERLRRSVETTVPLTLTREVEADVLVAARAAAGAIAGAAIPYDAFFVKLLAAALRARPGLNSMIENGELVIFEEINVGVAVSLPDGLVAPVIRQADTLSLRQVATQIRELAERARANALHAEDLAGGTVTLTNLGGFGVDAFTPVLNPPQSCILGVGRIRPRPVARDGVVVLAPTCVLSLTFDHRVTDGAPAAQLLDGLARSMNDAAFLHQFTEAT